MFVGAIQNMHTLNLYADTQTANLCADTQTVDLCVDTQTLDLCTDAAMERGLQSLYRHSKEGILQLIRIVLEGA